MRQPGGVLMESFPLPVHLIPPHRQHELEGHDAGHLNQSTNIQVTADQRIFDGRHGLHYLIKLHSPMKFTDESVSGCILFPEGQK